MKEFGERLRFARKRAGFSQKQLAEKVTLYLQRQSRPVETQVISILESGRVKSSSYLVPLANILQVSTEWLAHGVERGSVSVIHGKNQHFLEQNPYYPSTTDYLPVIDWEEVRDYMKSNHNEKNFQGKELIAKPKAMSLDSFVVVMNDPCMISSEGYFHKGDLLYFDPNVEPQDDDFVLVRHKTENESYFRRLTRVRNQKYLTPMNESFKSEKLSSDIRLLAVLIGKFTKVKNIK